MKLLSYENFNEAKKTRNVYHVGLPKVVDSTAEFLKTVKEIDDTLLNSIWKYDGFLSRQADSKFPSAWAAIETENPPFYAICVMHDDYDNSEWGVFLMDMDNNSGEDVELVSIRNLDAKTAWNLFAQIAGKENAFCKEGNRKISIEEWYDLNPLYKSEKLKKHIKLGVLDESYIEKLSNESVKFVKQQNKENAKTSIYNVSKDDNIIGQVKWSGRARGYAFLPSPNCSAEITAFVKDLMAKRRAEKKKEKLNEKTDLNDAVLMSYRANKQNAALRGEYWDRKKSISKEERDEIKKRQREIEKDIKYKNKLDAKIHTLRLEINDLKKDRQFIMNDMENDPSIEPNGGMVADYYGKKIEEVDKEIEKLQKKIYALENPIERSRKLKNIKHIGIFDKDGND